VKIEIKNHAVWINDVIVARIHEAPGREIAIHRVLRDYAGRFGASLRIDGRLIVGSIDELLQDDEAA
jgi:hypothetical protein